MYLEDILAVFALSEEEQGRYFPRWEQEVWVSEGLWETYTRFARLPALMVLAEMCARDRADRPLAQLCAEIGGLARLLIEFAGTYEWLIWHPREIQEEPTPGRVAPDGRMYLVWDVLRRLCREACALRKGSVAPPPFEVLFADVIGE